MAGQFLRRSACKGLLPKLPPWMVADEQPSQQALVLILMSKSCDMTIHSKGQSCPALSTLYKSCLAEGFPVTKALKGHSTSEAR